jgi:hypothetical protein
VGTDQPERPAFPRGKVVAAGSGIESQPERAPVLFDRGGSSPVRLLNCGSRAIHERESGKKNETPSTLNEQPRLYVFRDFLLKRLSWIAAPIPFFRRKY